MTPKEKAQYILDSYTEKVDESDFHIPEFISGVSMKSEEYKTVLKDETHSLAKECAMFCVQLIIDKHIDDWDSQPEYWLEVRNEMLSL